MKLREYVSRRVGDLKYSGDDLQFSSIGLIKEVLALDDNGVNRRGGIRLSYSRASEKCKARQCRRDDAGALHLDE